jgi:hypothetical protein
VSHSLNQAPDVFVFTNTVAYVSEIMKRDSLLLPSDSKNFEIRESPSEAARKGDKVVANPIQTEDDVDRDVIEALDVENKDDVDRDVMEALDRSTRTSLHLDVENEDEASVRHVAKAAPMHVEANRGNVEFTQNFYESDADMINSESSRRSQLHVEANDGTVHFTQNFYQSDADMEGHKR